MSDQLPKDFEWTQIEYLEQENKELTAENEKLKAEIAALQAKIDAADRQEPFFENYKYKLYKSPPITSEREKELLSQIEFWQSHTPTEAKELIRMRDRIELLRGALKTASGRFFDAGDNKSANDCMEWVGDMEAPLKEKRIGGTWAGKDRRSA